VPKAPYPPFTIIIDSREQKPYSFPEVETVVQGLKTGDYSIVGLEDHVCVERKNHADAYGTIGSGRARFCRELERMATFDYAAIVIECTLKSFLQPPPYTQLTPNSAIQSLISWSIRYSVHVYFVDRRLYGRALTFRILEKFWRHWLRTNPEEK